MSVSLVGPIVATPDVEDAISATIALWIDEYLGEVEVQHDMSRGFVARPNSYNETYDYDNWPEGQLPSVAVVCPGTVGGIERASEGYVSAWFEATVSIIVTDQTEGAARRVAGLYLAAVATLLEQQGSLRAEASTPFAQATRVMSTDTRLPDTENRTLAVGSAVVRVLVDQIFNRLAGPVAPPPVIPPGDLSVVETVSVTFDATEPGESA